MATTQASNPIQENSWPFQAFLPSILARQQCPAQELQCEGLCQLFTLDTTFKRILAEGEQFSSLNLSLSLGGARELETLPRTPQGSFSFATSVESADALSGYVQNLNNPPKIPDNVKGYQKALLVGPMRWVKSLGSRGPCF